MSYANAKQSLRIWFSGSSSIDKVYTLALEKDSSSTGYRIEIGQKFTKTGKPLDYLSHISFSPSEGFANFFKAWENLDPFQYKDQEDKDFEIVYDNPFRFIIVEYAIDHKYIKFRFQTGAPAYRKVEEFLRTKLLIM